MEVLEKKRAVLADSLRLVWVWHWDTVAGAVEGVLRGGVPVIVVVTVQVAVVLAIRGVSSLEILSQPTLSRDS